MLAQSNAGHFLLGSFNGSITFAKNYYSIIISIYEQRPGFTIYQTSLSSF
jgi:hypothetical protein